MEANLDTVEKLKRRDEILKLQYFKTIRALLSTAGCWPGDELGQKTHRLAKYYQIYLPLLMLSVLVGEIHYMVTNDLDFLALGESIQVFLITLIVQVRLFLPLLKGYAEVIRDFIMDFHLMHFKHKNTHFNKVHQLVDKVCHYCTIYVTIYSIMIITLSGMSPLYFNYKSGAFSQEKNEKDSFYATIPFSFPFFSPSNNLKFLSFFNIYVTCFGNASICILDLLITIMVIHITGHIVILKRNLESIALPEESKKLMLNLENNTFAVQYEVFNEEENKRISLILKECVGHHRNIVRFTDKLSDFFSFLFASNYTFQLVSVCIVLLETTQGDLVACIRFGPLLLGICNQLIQVSVVFEILNTASEKLPDALYCIPWECLDISNQRTVCIFLHRLQRFIYVTALGMTNVGVTTMAGILKTTFSYFMFLRSMK